MFRVFYNNVTLIYDHSIPFVSYSIPSYIYRIEYYKNTNRSSNREDEESKRGKMAMLQDLSPVCFCLAPLIKTYHIRLSSSLPIVAILYNIVLYEH